MPVSWSVWILSGIDLLVRCVHASSLFTHDVIHVSASHVGHVRCSSFDLGPSEAKYSMLHARNPRPVPRRGRTGRRDAE